MRRGHRDIVKGKDFYGVLGCSLREPGVSEEHIASIFRMEE
jgi:hypothetical protein